MFRNDAASARKRIYFIVLGIGLVLFFQVIALANPTISCGACSREKTHDSSLTDLSGLSGELSDPSVFGDGTGGEQQPDDSIVVTTVEEPKVIIPMLINVDNVMSADYMPTNLTQIGNEVRGTSTIEINKTVFDAYKLMYAAIEKDGVKPPMIISAYRSYAKQKQLYDKKVAEYGVGQKVTAIPGTSEHQYSACIDLSTDGTCQNNFGQLEVGKWIAANSYKYGFVVRYPDGKKEITKINFEPWHIRYVGVEHATYMYEHDMCLEEYVEYLRKTYPDAVDEQTPDDFPAPRWAGDTGEGDTPPAA